MPKRAYSVASSVTEDDASSVESPAPSISTTAPNKRRNTGSTAKAAKEEAKENRKAARKERNRISAQLSRDRKKYEKETLASRLETAELQVQQLTRENEQLRAEISKNKDLEDQLDGLRSRFLELEKMMLAVSGSRRSPSVQPDTTQTQQHQQQLPKGTTVTFLQSSVTRAQQQTTPKLEEQEMSEVELEEGAARKPELTSCQVDVAEVEELTPSSIAEEQDSRIGSETHATDPVVEQPLYNYPKVNFGQVAGPFPSFPSMLPSNIPATTTFSTFFAANSGRQGLQTGSIPAPSTAAANQIDVANLVQALQQQQQISIHCNPTSQDASSTPQLGSPAATEEEQVDLNDLSSTSPFYFLADEHLLLSPPSLPVLPGQATEQQQSSSSSAVTTPDSSSVETAELLDQDLLASFLADEDLYKGTDESRSRPETDLLFGFSYEALVDDSHKSYYDSFPAHDTVMV